MSLELAVQAMKSGSRGVFFTLEYTEKDMLDRFRAIGVEPEDFSGLFEFDSSDDISADYIVKRLATAPRGTLVVVDYLQLLDQKRENPELMVQVQALRSFARERGLIFVFISQIDRSYDPLMKPCPGLEDVRLPNPLDLGLFTKTCFLNNGEVGSARPARRRLRKKKALSANQQGLCHLEFGKTLQLTRFQVWPPQNMPPKAQPCTRSEPLLFIAIVASYFLPLSGSWIRPAHFEPCGFMLIRTFSPDFSE